MISDSPTGPAILSDGCLPGDTDRDQCVINAPDRAEEADKRGCRTDGGKYGKSALHFGSTVVNRSSQAFGEPFGKADFRLQILFTSLMQTGGLQAVSGKCMKGIVVGHVFRLSSPFAKVGAFQKAATSFERPYSFHARHARHAMIVQEATDMTRRSRATNLMIQPP